MNSLDITSSTARLTQPTQPPQTPRLPISPELRELHSRLPGMALYCVGGAVRDALLGRKPGDEDICGPYTPDEMAEACAKGGVSVKAQAPKLGTLALSVDINGVSASFEYTAFRAESYTRGHRPDAVEFTRSIERDAERRDFTVNALYLDVATGEVLDPTGRGLDDLHCRKLCAIAAQTLRDDGLRILRLARFAAELGFAVDPSALRQAKANAKNLDEIAPERIGAEFAKIIMSDMPFSSKTRFMTPAHKRALLILRETGALSIIEKSLETKDIDACANAPRDIRLRLAALFSRLTPAELDAALLRLRFPAGVRKDALALVSALAVARTSAQPSAQASLDTQDMQVMQVMQDMHSEVGFILASLNHERAALFVKLLYAISDDGGDNCASSFAAELSRLERMNAPFSTDELAISGEDICKTLGIEPSPRVGRVKMALWRACVCGAAVNTREGLRKCLVEYIKDNDYQKKEELT